MTDDENKVCEECVITYDELKAEQAEQADKSRTTIPNRLKSWAVWLSVLGAIGVILNGFGVFEKIGLDSTAWDIVVNAAGSILIAFGILNNPTDKTSF
jgi:uncharacterized membrane protein